MFGLSPLALKAIGIAVAALILFGAYQAWAYHERKLGEAAIIAADAKAIADQKTKDAALSAKLATDLQAKLDAQQAIVAPIREKIVRVPVKMDCAQSPAIKAASDGVKVLLAAPK